VHPNSLLPLKAKKHSKIHPELKLYNLEINKRRIGIENVFGRWLDAMHYKIKEEGRYVNKAAYSVLRLNTEGHKEPLGLYLSESEGDNYWLSVLIDLQNRGIQDILMPALIGLKASLKQLLRYFRRQKYSCIIHQIRNSLPYVASKDQKAFMIDLQPVYRADIKQAAKMALDELEAKWEDKYKKVIR
jgi:transposase-like protein